MRHVTSLGLATLAIVGGLSVLADDKDKPQPLPSGRLDGPDRATRELRIMEAIPDLAAREKVALPFVRQHYTELAELVEALKLVRPDEYERAINELYLNSRSLGHLMQQDQERYAAALEAWKAKSKLHVLAARLATKPTADLEAELHTAVERHFDAQLRLQKLERSTYEARLRKMSERIDRAEKNRDEVIRGLYREWVKKAQAIGSDDKSNTTPATP